MKVEKWRQEDDSNLQTNTKGNIEIMKTFSKAYTYAKNRTQ